MEQIIQSIKDSLIEYLDIYNIQISKSNPVVCINPKHDDTNPSMHLFYHRDGSPLLHCFACDAIYSTVEAAKILDDDLDEYDDFVTVIKTTGEKLGMEVSDIENGNKEIEQMVQFRKIYARAAQVVAGDLSDWAQQYLDDHMVSSAMTKKAGLGSASITDLQEELKDFDEELVKASGVYNVLIFNGESLIIPIRDYRGRVVSFKGRLNRDNNPKFISCKSPLGTAKSVLYGQDLIKSIEDTKLHVVEGPIDALALMSLEYPLRAVAVSGLDISPKQAEQIRRLAPSKVTLMLDGDAAAEKALAQRLIPTLMKEQIIPIPVFYWNTVDPCEYLSGHPDLDLLQAHNLIETYCFYSGIDHSEPIHHLMDKLVDMISLYSSPISRDILVSQLSKRSEVAEASIKLALEKIDKDVEANTQKEQEKLVKGVISQLRNDPSGASFTLQDALDKIQGASYNYDAVSSKSFASIVTQIKLNEEDPNKFPGFELNGFPELGDALRGPWTGKFIVVAGDENSGKSSYAAALLYDIISNPKNNALGIVHSTDDSLEEALQKYVCLSDQRHGAGRLSYLNVKSPHYPSEHYASAKDVLVDREKAYDNILELIHDERLIIKDLAVSSSVSFTEELVSYYRKKYPERNIVVLLDSFNRAVLPNATTDARMNATRMSNICASIAIRYNCAVISVNEFNRPQERNPEKVQWPNTKRLAEARAIEYDAKAIILLYNDLHSRTRQYADILWKDAYGNLRPRVAALIAKNKISNPKPTLYYDFDEIRCKFMPIDEYSVKVERLQTAKERTDHNTNLNKMVNTGVSSPEHISFREKMI